MDIKNLSQYINLENENLSFGLITILLVFTFILIANVMRRKITIFRRSLMPTAVIAGLLGLIIKEIVLYFWNVNIFNTTTLNHLIFHMLPIGFIALSLREKENYQFVYDKNKVKTERVSSAKSGCVIISVYLLQALIGILVTVIIANLFLPELNKAVGIILPLGFGQGPQQANATGYIWDAAGHLSAWGQGSARNFGITIAALGFLWSSIPGVFLVNRIAKKRGIIIDKDILQRAGDVKSTNIEDATEIPLSESIDKFTLQICMVGGVYLITIGFIVCLEIIIRFSRINFLIDFIPTIWGFSFMIACLIALITKNTLRKLIKRRCMHRKYPNSYMMNRISGAAFDISITGALFLISPVALGTLWIPVLAITSFGGLATIFYLKRMTSHIYKDYKDEAFLVFYGNLTGTIANGMILLREIDKNFETPASEDLVLGSAGAIILGFPLLLLIAQAPKDGNLWWVASLIAIYLLGLIFFLTKNLILKKKTIQNHNQ